MNTGYGQAGRRARRQEGRHARSARQVVGNGFFEQHNNALGVTTLMTTTICHISFGPTGRINYKVALANAYKSCEIIMTHQKQVYIAVINTCMCGTSFQKSQTATKLITCNYYYGLALN